ncbi:MAG: primosomal protein N' [Candidatus Omnitrophota bacterium]|nr:primosomal protein N' [Candidatus Omnitrophota bacterium]
MSYVKVVVGLPLDGPFDYLVPAEFVGLITPGCRLQVSFGPRKIIAYAVALSKDSPVLKCKPVLKVIDSTPVLNSAMLALTKQLAEHYCCSWGQAIEAALPQELRSGKVIPEAASPVLPGEPGRNDAFLVHAGDDLSKWEKYLDYIKEALKDNASVIVLLAGIGQVMKARGFIQANLGFEPELLFRKDRGQLAAWLRVREGKAKVILGTRSAVFAPAVSLGLIIVDEEQDPAYKQEQVPHYHARDAALMRGSIEKARVALGSLTPSLESFYLAKSDKIKYILVPGRKNFPEIKVLNTTPVFFKKGQTKPLFSKYLQDCVYTALEAKKRVLLFLNRRGFATYAACHNCGVALKCPRCNISLVYHSKENILGCHHCNFKLVPPRICPSCNSGYIKYSGSGTQKLENALAGVFPAAKIVDIDDKAVVDLAAGDIYVATSSVFKEADTSFALAGVLMIDNSLNRVDLRSAEKVYGLLINLARLTGERLVIETGFPGHHAIKALEAQDANIFYDEELKQRRQLGFPPFRHLILLKVRGKDSDKARSAAEELFNELNREKKSGLLVMSLSPGLPPKLRDYYYWQILIGAGSLKRANAFLKNSLKTSRHSGIIVTVDVDPV